MLRPIHGINPGDSQEVKACPAVRLYPNGTNLRRARCWQPRILAEWWVIWCRIAHGENPHSEASARPRARTLFLTISSTQSVGHARLDDPHRRQAFTILRTAQSLP